MDTCWRAYQKRLQKPGPPQKGWVFGLFIVAVVGVLLLWDPLLRDQTQGGTPISLQVPSRTPWTLESEEVRFGRDFNPSFQTMEGGRFVESLDARTRVVYTVDPVLQREMEDLFARYDVPYGVFVAMDPESGRILALVEHSSDDPTQRHLALRATYPAASIFKLVTASAAMEKGKVDPDTVIRFRGGLYDMNPKTWRDNPKRDRNKITLQDALAKSCNVAFAKVALRWLKAPDLRNYAALFGFNREMDFEIPADRSAARIPQDEKSLAMTAAGFGEVGLSPLHGAMIASMIANGGVMMAPRLVEKVIRDGEEVYTLKEKVVGRSLRPETAEALGKMMTRTITKGTSRHAFSQWGNTPDLHEIPVGGKTGSLEGANPPGDYNWFVGMAPIGGAKIAVAALVINHEVWRIKASYVAREGLRTYFQKSSHPVSVPVISQNPAAGSGSGSRG